ncbi:MAG: hypothetical protein FJ241_12670 [Nitrospira sp.]|nr:hypothetical protein [Nitrospira sp.]
MKSQLYVPEKTRKYLKSEISSYVEIYFQKLLPVFKDIENDAENYAKDFYDNFMSQPAYDEFIDPASIAEKALEIGIEHFSYLKLGKYNLTATWHATLYQLWEQQLRLFLFREMSHVYKLEIKTFCTTIERIKEKFLFHNVDIESFPCWPRINELRLLCNVIKHGPGDSERKLLEIKPDLFKKDNDIDYMEVYKTTLLEETLNIDETTLQNYKDALLSFWDEIPERNYSQEL